MCLLVVLLVLERAGEGKIALVNSLVGKVKSRKVGAMDASTSESATAIDALPSLMAS